MASVSAQRKPVESAASRVSAAWTLPPHQPLGFDLGRQYFAFLGQLQFFCRLGEDARPGRFRVLRCSRARVSACCSSACSSWETCASASIILQTKLSSSFKKLPPLALFQCLRPSTARTTSSTAGA